MKTIIGFVLCLFLVNTFCLELGQIVKGAQTQVQAQVGKGVGDQAQVGKGVGVQAGIGGGYPYVGSGYPYGGGYPWIGANYPYGRNYPWIGASAYPYGVDWNRRVFRRRIGSPYW